MPLHTTPGSPAKQAPRQSSITSSNNESGSSVSDGAPVGSLPLDGTVTVVEACEIPGTSTSSNQQCELSAAPAGSPETGNTDVTESDQFDDEDASPNSENGQSSSSKKVMKGKRKSVKEKDAIAVLPKDSKNLTFEPDLKKRTVIVKGRGPTIKRMAEELKRRTDSQVFVKIKYVSPHRHQPYTYTYGNDFEVDASPVVSEERGSSPGNAALSDQGAAGGPDTAVASTSPGLGPRATVSIAAGLSQEPVASPTPDEEDMIAFQSPHASKQHVVARRRHTSQPGCTICKKNEPFLFLDDVRVDAEFFRCAHEPCEGKIHNDCAGFPSATFEDIKLYMPWYCPVHRGEGRAPIEFTTTPGVTGPQPHDVPISGSSTPARPSGFNLPGRTRSRSGGRLDLNVSQSASATGSSRGRKKSSTGGAVTVTGQEDDQEGREEGGSESGISRGGSRGGRGRGGGRGSRGSRGRGGK